MEHSKLRATELLLALSLVSAGAADAQSWKSLEHRPPFGASTALLLTDGTVVCQEYLSSNWWRLTPNIFGNYQKGTWSRLASMPKEYNPLYYSSAVLADGRMIVAGGEYNNDFSNPVWTNKAAIYDPKTNTWGHPLLRLLAGITSAMHRTAFYPMATSC